MKRIIGVFAATTGLVTTSALANDDWYDGQWYVGGQVGANFLLDGDVDGLAGVNEASYDTDIYGGLVFGRHFRPQPWGAILLEVEGFYRRAEIDEISPSSSSPSPNGDVDSYGGMFNIIYSADQLDWPVIPYIGGGVGYAEFETDIDLGNGLIIDDDDGVVAYQGIIGARYPINEEWSMTLDGRYVGAENPEFTVNGQTVEFEYDTIQVTFGVQYRF